MSWKLNYVAVSDRGLVRGNNEDSAYAGPHLLLLADGMGGHAAGEVASQLMVEHMEHLDRDPGDADMLALLGAAADDANASIEAAIADNPEYDGMGTTLTALMFNGEQAGLIHVGDSRGYRLRDGELTQVTEDDTFVQSLVNEGRLAPEDVSSHPQKSLILKAYTGRPVEPHLETLDVEVGDRFLMCSDGLSDPVTAETIEETLSQGTPEEAANKLIGLALRSGGPDNVTVVVADVVDAEGGDFPDLPTKPALAGALALPADESHPSTAASRAAALMRVSKEEVRPAEQPDDEDAEPVEAADDAEATPEEDVVDDVIDDEDIEVEGTKKRNWLWPVVAVLLALALIAGGIYWWANNAKDDRFFISTNDAGEFVIEQGFDSNLFGSSMHNPVQKVCINNENEIRPFSIDSQPGDCHVFTVDDLPSSARGNVANLDSGDYGVVTAQLERLGQEALPVCVDGQGESCREVK